ncbi:MAG: hsp70 family protein [Methylococcales bacterium]|nr:hsp70 family protein [Methylococcales bacterium]
MNNKAPQYFVGIDLGTTHVVVAYTSADKSIKQPKIQIFDIEQLVAQGEVASRPLLPAVRYHPAEGELSEVDINFSPTGEYSIIGEAARVLGAKTQGRFVTSAKSWLSHPSVDHTADILPWSNSDDVKKISPLEASASYLAHIRMVWAHKFPNAPLEQQSIVITVPASFDEVARSLTIEAAKIAGLTDVRLLEEPQAVCYDWLLKNAGNVKQQLEDIHLLLICDVGGGTTDLTLIKIEQGETEPKLTRIGVGDHLMLGGDNIDLALAHLAESRLSSSKKLSAADLSQLLEQCRVAKEKLLAEDAPEQIHVTLLGGGSKLIGGSRTTQLNQEEVRKIALDGFFPLSQLTDLPDKKRSGVVEFGLPYAAEPAVSKHIAAFLSLHKQAASEALTHENYVPDGILLNGGVFRSKPMTERIINLVKSWNTEQKTTLLKNERPELSVAYGAVSYALARRDKKLKIGGGSARSYFLRVDTDTKGATQQGICLLPKGSEEGDEVFLKEQQFALRIGQPVQFLLASTTSDTKYKPGELVEIIDDKFNTLPPLAVVFEGSSADQIEVQLAVTQTEIGTLKIQCVALSDNSQRFDVEFQIRKKGGKKSQTAQGIPTNFHEIEAKIQAVFGAKSKKVDPKAVKSLRVSLEKGLNLSRNEWETPLLREIFSTLLEGVKVRRRSDNHERVWLTLIGFCLRPGFGYPLDEWRIEQLWKIYPHSIQFVNEKQNWTEWWTLWRRIAGGLSTEAQEQIFNDISKFLNPAAARQAGVAKQSKIRGYDDMVRLVGVLERLPVDKKIIACEWLLKRLEKSSEPNQTWWAVGRIASRIPFYSSNHHVIPAEIVAPWLQQLLKINWKKVPQAGFAATLIARMSGDRARDLDNDIRSQIVEKLKENKSPTSWVEMVESYKELDEQEAKQVFGETLPPGLKLISNT